MRSLLYLGNMSSKKASITVMEAHIALLAQHFNIYAASGRKHKIWRMLDMVALFLRRQRRADYVLISVYSTLNFYYAWVIALLCRVFQKPYIAYLHGGNLPTRLLRSPGMSKAIFAHSHANVAPSGYLQKAFERAGFHCINIPNFIEIKGYPFVHRSKLRPNLLWVRSFEKTYHPEMTIQVLASLQKTHPNARLCMVGPDKDGSMESCKLLAAALGLSQHLEFKGSLSKSEWIALSTNYDIFISSTRFDNTPVSVIEAMALGMPVVSTNVGGMPYLITSGEDGMLSAEDDVADMVQNIEKLLSSTELASSISATARQKVSNFDWEVVKHQWLSLLAPKT